MNYLFIVQGEGRGHMTQAITLSELLIRNGHKVTSVLLGKSKNREIPSFFRKEINAEVFSFDTFSFKYKKNRKNVHMLKTILYNTTPKRLKKYKKSIEFVHAHIQQKKPDVIVNFYEILNGFVQLRYKNNIPVINIGHQYLLRHPDFKYGTGDDLNYMFLRLHVLLNTVGSTKTLALSFYPLKDNLAERIAVVPPLIRKEIRELRPQKKEYFLIYIVNHGYEDDIRKWHEKNPAVPLVCFWDKKGVPERWEIDKNLIFFTIDDKKFIEYMGNCRGYLSTAGFESICEAFYLNKPVLMVPSHVEQMVNAKDATSTGKGIYSTGFDIKKMETLLNDNAFPTDDDFKNWVNSGEEIFLRHLTTFV
ncbi:MAG: hypothetical protein LUG18_10580 [Candidatus Azobacteroides sp.]|nr:hypothetical protein [Candidatus Azobacteroides sp.]